MANRTDSVYGSIPVFRGFASLMDPKLYSPLPDDWTIGVADIVESTKAIANQRYKAVNMAGASVIAAVTTDAPAGGPDGVTGTAIALRAALDQVTELSPAARTLLGEWLSRIAG